MFATTRLTHTTAFIVAALLTFTLKSCIGHNFVQQGEASFYSNAFEGELTASGETFKQSEMTAAHKYLPLGTKVTVIHNSTGKEIEVRINDRGPYVEGRIIDLTTSAWKALGLELKAGITDVTLKARIEHEIALELKDKLENIE